MRHAVGISVLLLGVWTCAQAQQQPSRPSKSASGAANSTAPTNPTTRVLQVARPSDGGQRSAVTPQVAIPLNRAASGAVALKPGKSGGASGGVNDTVARCKAGTASAVSSKCTTP